MRRFLAALPEVARRGLYRRARCHSILEYASKYAGASKEVVETVFLVHRRIGKFQVLWSLFAQGKTGLTVFRRISRHVTAENASWWAGIIQSCTLKEIECILDEFEAAHPSAEEGGQLPIAPAERTANAVIRATAGQESPGPDGALPHQHSVPHQADSVPDQASTLKPGPFAQSVFGQTQSPSPEAPSFSGVAHTIQERPAEAVAADRAANLTGEQPRDNNSNSPVRQRRAAALTPMATRIAETLVAQYGRRGLTVSVAEVIEAALKHVAVEGVLPGLQGQATIREADQSKEAGPEYTQQGLGDPDPGASPGAVASGIQTAIPSEPKRLRLPKVLVSISEVGMTFLRTIGGLIPLSATEADALDSGKPPITYHDLMALAEGAGERAAGRNIPAAVKLAIWVRSAGQCEARGCNNPIEEFEHLDPYSEVKAHRPSRMAGLCPHCHRARHNGLIANPNDLPCSWRYITVGRPRRSRAVDRLVQASRQRACHRALQPPKVGKATGS